ncbi:hypothetical protein B0T14DRAFT_497283 [Immersiella caudata]|uniref:RING-type domain-containing protein n=1 Tax=Immersiella caudata TaxID=314043 RepID=A0AA39WSR1_9PEZI|nr:hypothetical protein B0T14DRAFT_497283 [Immersiella caudata]
MAGNNRSAPEGFTNPPRTPSPPSSSVPSSPALRAPPPSPVSSSPPSTPPTFELTFDHFGGTAGHPNVSEVPTNSSLPSSPPREASPTSSASGDDTDKYPIGENRFNEPLWHRIKEFLLRRLAEPEQLVPSPEFTNMGKGKGKEVHTSGSDPKVHSSARRLLYIWFRAKGSTSALFSWHWYSCRPPKKIFARRFTKGVVDSQVHWVTGQTTASSSRATGQTAASNPRSSVTASAPRTKPASARTSSASQGSTSTRSNRSDGGFRGVAHLFTSTGQTVPAPRPRGIPRGIPSASNPTNRAASRPRLRVQPSASTSSPSQPSTSSSQSQPSAPFRIPRASAHPRIAGPSRLPLSRTHPLITGPSSRTHPTIAGPSTPRPVPGPFPDPNLIPVSPPSPFTPFQPPPPPQNPNPTPYSLCPICQHELDIAALPPTHPHRTRHAGIIFPACAHMLCVRCYNALIARTVRQYQSRGQFCTIQFTCPLCRALLPGSGCKGPWLSHLGVKREWEVPTDGDVRGQAGTLERVLGNVGVTVPEGGEQVKRECMECVKLGWWEGPGNMNVDQRYFPAGWGLGWNAGTPGGLGERDGARGRAQGIITGRYAGMEDEDDSEDEEGAMGRDVFDDNPVTLTDYDHGLAGDAGFDGTDQGDTSEPELPTLPRGNIW